MQFLITLITDRFYDVFVLTVSSFRKKRSIDEVNMKGKDDRTPPAKSFKSDSKGSKTSSKASDVVKENAPKRQK